MPRQLDEVSFGSQPDNSLCPLFSAGIVNFCDETGKRLRFFLRSGFHFLKLICNQCRYYGVFAFLFVCKLPSVIRQKKYWAMRAFIPSPAAF